MNSSKPVISPPIISGERKMLHNARQVLLSEIVLAKGGDYRAVEARVDTAMMCNPAV